MSHVTISQGNSKMGMIRSISLPAVMTCIQCDCNKICYARKIERIRPNVAKSYRENLEVLNADPELYWRIVDGAMKLSNYFRFHVSGDIPDDNYFANMIKLSEENQHCQVLCFTKKYDIVNKYLESGGLIPNNLKIIFSAWVGLKMTNPFFVSGSACAL